VGGWYAAISEACPKYLGAPALSKGWTSNLQTEIIIISDVYKYSFPRKW
jgi:hypothetical protein